jgi:hypothetical protein
MFYKACKVTFFEAFFQHLGGTRANSALQAWKPARL